jgi:hypothetical protein
MDENEMTERAADALADFIVADAEFRGLARVTPEERAEAIGLATTLPVCTRCGGRGRHQYVDTYDRITGEHTGNVMCPYADNGLGEWDREPTDDDYAENGPDGIVYSHTVACGLCGEVHPC